MYIHKYINYSRLIYNFITCFLTPIWVNIFAVHNLALFNEIDKATTKIDLFTFTEIINAADKKALYNRANRLRVKRRNEKKIEFQDLTL